jgi:Zn-dependent protease/predicted transcriptional regulator
MGGTIKIGKIAGIQIAVHWSWVFIFALLTWSFASGGGILDIYPEWSTEKRIAVAVVISGIFFTSILLHELSHSLVAKSKGIPVRSITLFVFGGVSSLGREAQSAGEEFQIAIVGPLTSLLLGALFAVLWLALRPMAPKVASIASYLAFINTVLAVFNMLPGYPLDGGRVLRSIMWARNHNVLRATRIAARSGEGVAYLLMAVGAVVFYFAPISGIWFFMIGLFLRNASMGSYEQLVMEQTIGPLTAGDLAKTDFVPIGPEMTVAELVDGHMLAGRGRAYPVMAGEELLGLITLSDVRHLDRAAWPTTSVYRAMTPRERLHTVSRQEPAGTVLHMMAERDINQVPVMDGRLLTGIISRGDVLRLIQDRRALISNA